MSGRQNSNLQHPVPKTGDLPIDLRPEFFKSISILLYLFSKVKWWDHLDLNQESTNYEFAALTNYAIVPRVRLQILEATCGARRYANVVEDTFFSYTKFLDSQDDNQSIQYSSE